MGNIEHSVPEPRTLAEAAETIQVGCEWLAGRVGTVEAERDIAVGTLAAIREHTDIVGDEPWTGEAEYGDLLRALVAIRALTGGE